MDIRTVLFCLFLVNLFLGFFIYIVRNTQHRFAGIDFWIYSNFLIATGYLLLSIRNDINLSISIILSQLCFIVAGFLRISGTRKFFNYGYSRLPVFFGITVLAFLLIISYYTFVQESILHRTLIQGFILSSISIWNGVLIYSNRPSKNKSAYTITAISFFTFSGIFLLRIVRWLLEPDDRGLFNDSFINQLQFLSSMIIDIIWSVMFFVMQNQRLNNQLQDREKRLSDLNLGKDRFLSILAHDIKNVFNSLINIHDLFGLKGTAVSKAEAENFMSVLQSTTIKGYDIFEDLLLWSASNLKKLTPNFQKLEIGELIELVSEKIDAGNNQKNIQVNNLTKDKPIYIFADQTMLQSVLRNLLSNALKYTSKKGIINITAVKKANEVVISVQDNGVGISETNISKLFKFPDKFTTVGTAKEQGTGLGLILCKELVELHDGRIWAESKIGEGSKFSFSIPVASSTKLLKGNLADS